ncbi:hypothetical protein EBZ35_07070 [bacterium]|nr:hypothetical protein [bacterium]
MGSIRLDGIFLNRLANPHWVITRHSLPPQHGHAPFIMNGLSCRCLERPKSGTLCDDEPKKGGGFNEPHSWGTCESE